MAIRVAEIQREALQLVTRALPTASASSREQLSPEQTALASSTKKALKAILEQYDWSFAQKRAILVPYKIYVKTKEEVIDERYTTQYLGWKNGFLLPLDYLGFLKIYTSNWKDTYSYSRGTDEVAWRIASNSIYTMDNFSDKGLNIQYTYYDTNRLNLPEMVELSIIYYLAHLIAPALIGSFATSEQYYALYKTTILKAKELDIRNRVPVVQTLESGLNGWL